MSPEKTNKMEATSSLSKIKVNTNINFAIDTTFVLFFLAVDFGQNIGAFAFDTVFLAVTLLSVMILPYFATSEEKPEFGNWLLGRSLIVVFAVIAGLMFRQALGTVLPESFKFLPLTLVIVTAILTCYIQYYSFLKLRLSK